MMLQRMWMRGMAGWRICFHEFRRKCFYDCRFPVTEIPRVNRYALLPGPVHWYAALSTGIHWLSSCIHWNPVAITRMQGYALSSTRATRINRRAWRSPATLGMFRTPKSLRSTAPQGRRLFNYDSDDEGDDDDLREKRRNAKREHEELAMDGGAPDSPHTTVKAQRMLSYDDGVDVLGTIASLKDDEQEEVVPCTQAVESPKPLSQPSVITMEEDIEDGEGESQYYLHIRARAN